MSKDTKLFTIAGTSTFRGENTFRFANGKARDRVLVLKRNNHIDIRLSDLPHPMTKAQAIHHMETVDKIEAVMPKTGRGSGIKPEQIAKQEEIISQQAKVAAVAEAEVNESDAEFIQSLTTKPE